MFDYFSYSEVKLILEITLIVIGKRFCGSLVENTQSYDLN